MMNFRPISDETEGEALAARCNLPYRAAIPAYVAEQNGEAVALLRFRLMEDRVLLHSIGFSQNNTPERETITRELLYAVFTFAIGTGRYRLQCKKDFPAEYLRNEGFVEDSTGIFSLK